MTTRIVTYGDINYLPQGKALLESLQKSSIEYYVHYLCLDRETVYALEGNGSMEVYTDTFVFATASEDEKWNIFAQASLFTRYISTQYPDDLIIYVDNDIYFHQGLEVLVNAIGHKAVAIFSHLQFTPEMNRKEGLYNVGVVAFRGKEGFDVLNFWADAMEECKFPKLQKCYDQFYLNMFPELTDNITIDCVKHGSIWQWQVMSDEDIDNIVYSHMSHFKLTADGYIPSTQHQQYTTNAQVFANPKLKAIYNEYSEVVRSYSK